jgi:hypothetical protein
MNIIEALRTYNVYSPKIRIGNEHDGGYIVNELITTHTKKLISVGMGNDDGFERDWFSKYETEIEAYDGTYPCQTICSLYHEHVNKKIFYVKHNVGYGESLIPLNIVVDGKPDVLLKVDVEGAEYEIFDNIKLETVTGLILEVHDLHVTEKQHKLIELIENNFSDLMLFHIHGNSWGNTFTLNLSKTGIRGLELKEFPHVMELCFINKKLIQQHELETTPFPIENLDISNKRDVSDINLYWVNAL